MNALIPAAKDDFLVACAKLLKDGDIRITGDEEDGFQLAIKHDALEAAYRWLAERYDAKNGSDCMEFLTDEMLVEGTDEYAAKLLVQMLAEPNVLRVAGIARELRHHYARRKIEYFTTELVRMAAPEDPRTLPLEASKAKREVDRYMYPLLSRG